MNSSFFLLLCHTTQLEYYNHCGALTYNMQSDWCDAELCYSWLCCNICMNARSPHSSDVIHMQSYQFTATQFTDFKNWIKFSCYKLQTLLYNKYVKIHCQYHLNCQWWYYNSIISNHCVHFNPARGMFLTFTL